MDAWMRDIKDCKNANEFAEKMETKFKVETTDSEAEGKSKNKKQKSDYTELDERQILACTPNNFSR